MWHCNLRASICLEVRNSGWAWPGLCTAAVQCIFGWPTLRCGCSCGKTHLWESHRTSGVATGQSKAILAVYYPNMCTSLIEISLYTWYSFRLGFLWPMGWASCPRLTWSWWWWMGKLQRWALTLSCWTERVLSLSSCIPTPTQSMRRWRSQWEVRLASSYMNFFHAFMHLSFHISIFSKWALFTICVIFFLFFYPCLVVFLVCMYLFSSPLFSYLLCPLCWLFRGGRGGRGRKREIWRFEGAICARAI